MSPAGITLREATAGDSPALNALVDHTVTANGYDPEIVKRFAQNDAMDITPAHMASHPFWVAVQGEHIVGCIALDPKNGKTGQVCNFYVTPELKGNGIGRLLWFRLVLVAQTQGFTALSVSSDPVSVPFYEALGFRTQHMIPLPAFRDCALEYMTLPL